MGIDCEFRASSISDVDAVRALPDVFNVLKRPSGSDGYWSITTLIRFVGHGVRSGYAPDDRAPKVVALLRALRPYCTDLEYGGDNGVWFERVTDEMISEIERAEPRECSICPTDSRQTNDAYGETKETKDHG